MATGGMVASAHPLVTSAGLQTLAAGGNAVDAAVSAALVASVVMPEMCGLGGDLFAIVHDPRRPGPVTYLGSGIAPRGLSYERVKAASPGGHLMPNQGPLSIGVPGMVAGYRDLLREHGSKAFAELVGPALHHAEAGHPVGQGLADHFIPNVELLSSVPSSKAALLPGGKAPVAGQVLVQADLARTFRRLIDAGLDDFYQGDLAQRIAGGIQELGGALTVEDMAGHETEISTPLSVTYRGYRINQTGLPTQGLVHLEALKIAEHALRAEEFWSERYIHIQVEAIKLAFADRLGYAQDPRTGDTPVERLLSGEWAARRAAEIGDSATAEASAGQFQ
ncbi:MAG: gamma-glutamyltransferase, partial [Chloroflexota bacterium]|nr:gamma-glutamyltransferase [Chloroflexota bacterium]